MEIIKLKLSELNNEYMGKILKQKLRASDGVLDVTVDCPSQKVSISISHPSACDGVYCLIEELGYKVRKP
jgi:hypothetical protein